MVASHDQKTFHDISRHIMILVARHIKTNLRRFKTKMILDISRHFKICLVEAYQDVSRQFRTFNDCTDIVIWLDMSLYGLKRLYLSYVCV